MSQPDPESSFALCCVCTCDEDCQREHVCLIRKAHLDAAADREPKCYLGVFGGIVQVVAVDLGDEATAAAVSDIVREGGTIERVSLGVGRRALFEEWPLKEAEHVETR